MWDLGPDPPVADLAGLVGDLGACALAVSPVQCRLRRWPQVRGRARLPELWRVIGRLAVEEVE